MTASHYAQKAASENIPGLHYSRFWTRQHKANEYFQPLTHTENPDFQLIHRRIREGGLTSTRQAADKLEISFTAALDMIAALELRELTGRGRFRAWGD
jgi:hypothetical protein